MTVLIQQLHKKYNRIPTRPFVNVVLGLIVRIVTTYIVDMDKNQRKAFGKGLKELGLEIVEASAKGMIKGLAKEE